MTAAKDIQEQYPPSITETPNKSWRFRVNVIRNTKGKQFDCTVEVEGEGAEREEALAESDWLVGELDKRYPQATP